MKAEATGEIESQEGVLVIRRIRVVYHLTADPSHKETVERVHAIHKKHCPVYQSIRGSIDVETELKWVS